jgi:hypothetical protein
MSRRFARLARAALLALAAFTTPGFAEPRLEGRLDATTAAEVERLVARARAEGLPTEPLISKALEGEAKGAGPERIVSAVKAQLAAFGDARAALGAGAVQGEIVAGAGALLAGVPAESLARLRETRPAGRSLVVPLVVLADLVARKVPSAAAAGLVVAVSRSGARDADLLRMRERVEREIAAGMVPASAALAGARRILPGVRLPGDDRGPPPVSDGRRTTP